jgi:hypothetical protein
MQISMDIKEVPIKDDAEKIVDLEQDEDRKHADNDVICSDLSGNSNILTYVYLTGYYKMVSNTNIIILHMQINMDVEQVPIN